MVDNSVNLLESRFTSIINTINETETMASEFLDGIDNLSVERKEIEDKAESVIKFLHRFQLSDEQRDCLNNATLPDSLEDFLKALKRSEEIYQDCTNMLNEDGSLHSACIPVLEDISAIRETGLKRLYTYTQQICQTLNNEKALSPESLNSLRLSLYYLSLRPVYIEHCKESIVHSRRGDLSRKFIISLTRGSATSGYKPIELNAHDPIRYIGDMFAWIHQAVATEKEIISNLWSLIPNQENQQIDILGAIIGGLSKTFHVRVEQILMNTINALSAFKIYQVLVFYKGTLSLLLPEEGLISTIDTLSQSAESKIEECVSNSVSQITSGPPPYPVDLAPLHSVTDLMAEITNLLTLYEQSSITDTDKFSIEKILDIVINPIKDLFEKASQGLDPLDKSVFIINSLDSLITSLVQYQSAVPYVQNLRSELDDYVDILVNDQTTSIIQECGIDQIILQLQTKKPNEPLSYLQHSKYDEVKISIQHFTTILFSLPLPQFDLLSVKLRTQSKNRVYDNLVKLYEKLYNEIHNPKNQYDDPDSIMFHKPEQIKELF